MKTLMTLALGLSFLTIPTFAQDKKDAPVHKAKKAKKSKKADKSAK
jgi:hypothetical protein